MVMSTRSSRWILFSIYVGCTPLSPAEDPYSPPGTPPDQDPIEDTAPVDDGELSILTLDASGLHFSMDWYGQTTPEVGELRLSNTGTEDEDVLVEAPPWLLVEPSADTIPAEETVSVGLSVDLSLIHI